MAAVLASLHESPCRAATTSTNAPQSIIAAVLAGEVDVADLDAKDVEQALRGREREISELTVALQDKQRSLDTTRAAKRASDPKVAELRTRIAELEREISAVIEESAEVKDSLDTIAADRAGLLRSMQELTAFRARVTALQAGPGEAPAP